MRLTARTFTYMCDDEAQNETSRTLRFADSVRAIIAAPLSHYRASISHAYVLRVLIIIMSYITFILSAALVNPV